MVDMEHLSRGQDVSALLQSFTVRFHNSTASKSKLFSVSEIYFVSLFT